MSTSPQASIPVVIIEDDEEVRDLLRLLFELDGRFEVAALAADGRAGIAAVELTQPAAVILDLDLPEIAGPEVIKAIRAQSPRTRVVVFSAYPDPFTLLDVVRQGADSYLNKATSWLELIPTVVELCMQEADQRSE